MAKLQKDGNRAAKGGNWPVFDFCNQFLQVVMMMMMMMKINYAGNRLYQWYIMFALLLQGTSFMQS